MKKLFLLLLCLNVALFSCDIDQTEKGELPDVDVSVEEGDMPEYDIDWANVDVGTTTRTIEVPKVVVVTEEEQVEVPYVDVDMPEDDNNEKVERNLIVEAEVSGETHDLEIEEVYATGKRLIVISELEPTGQKLQDNKMRVSDQLVINAPDLDVKHYIIGEKPVGSFNNQYVYISSRNEISDVLQNGKAIYSKQ